MCKNLLCHARRRTGKGNGVRSHRLEVFDRSVDMERSTGEVEERINHDTDSLKDVPFFGFFRNGRLGEIQPPQEF